MNSLQILSFVGFTLLVAVITGGRSAKQIPDRNKAIFLPDVTKSAGYCRFVNVNQPFHGTLVGLSGQAYKSGMSVMGWEVLLR